MTISNLTSDVVTKAGVEVAVVLHEVWRDGYKKANGDVPRWKGTSDTAWVDANAGKPYCGPGKVDINIPFAQLPADWAAENAAAGAFAARIVANALLLGATPETLNVDELADQVHEAWLVRQRQQEVKPGETPYYVQQGQHVRFEKLPEAEKDKDRDQVKLALAKLIALAS